MISIICCWNDIHQFNELKKQIYDTSIIKYIELIDIDNREQVFCSAAEALNYGGNRANGEYLVFLHQDISITDGGLRQFINSYRSLEKIRELSILGLYGNSRDIRKINKNLIERQTLDECCVIMNKRTFTQLRFNEELCKGWHLYVVEFCIRLKRMGGTVASGNFDMKHDSIGNVDDNYMQTMKELLIAYKSEKSIYTTCKSFTTNMFLFYTYYCIWRIKKVLFGNYPIVRFAKDRIKTVRIWRRENENTYCK